MNMQEGFMSDTGYLSLKPGPSRRPGFIDPRSEAVEQWYDNSLTEGSSSKWPLVLTVIVACTLGVAIWSTLIYGIWGSLL